ncbi:Poly(A) RNA polymerase cid13 [Ophiocordyceps camponoti-floridani]|uniref:polynucleotide adenylyltransferase n=1 Tax=Ophiocordyceps camponoti-floridani TaxID=2030778 RepID=A0A8H4Q3K8_9HYPO|nr:Poly(A) RNA polymerase cid13 [Ophiocordyceps camponoti-floridani]
MVASITNLVTQDPTSNTHCLPHVRPGSDKNTRIHNTGISHGDHHLPQHRPTTHTIIGPKAIHTNRLRRRCDDLYTIRVLYMRSVDTTLPWETSLHRSEKESFRMRIEDICRRVITLHEQQQQQTAFEFPPQSIQLKCFGSLVSGFATKTSDMDLGLLSPLSSPQPDSAESPIPRLLEKAFLDAGLGARLLGRARVPIIKLCQLPPEPLLQSLIAERQKWEISGKNAVNEMADGEREGETGSPDHPDEEAPSQTTSKLSPSSPEIIQAAIGENAASGIADDGRERETGPPYHPEAQELQGELNDAEYLRLQQGPESSLASYYALAKRALRRAEGRDATISNYREFTELEWSILDGICEAFIQGLSDSTLRERLTRFPSLSFQSTDKTSSHRTLLGVYIQVEGERILQLWDAWSAKKALHNCQPQANQALATWNEIQQKRNFGADPVAYSRDLQLGLEKIKLVPSFQLLLLDQGPHEIPSQYHARAKAVLANLQRGSSGSCNAVQQVLVDRYVSGVSNGHMRAVLSRIVGSQIGQVDLEAVGLWHKALHLSRQLEATLTKETLSESQASDVKEYISLLQSLPPQRVPTGPSDHKFVIPVLPEAMDLVLRIRELHDLVAVSSQPRDRYRDPFEFPSTGVGVQCDINFSAHLALQNTALLRCYSYTDVRVRPMVLFVKHWAKIRGINSGYRGTLSSYGYVLMVLHYLVNVANPFVCPNLQQLAPPLHPDLTPAEIEATISCRGCNIRFWRDEPSIVHFATNNQLNRNGETLGHLLRGFFEYYAHNGMMSSGVAKGFDWGRDVLSLRTPGGLLTKQEKRWTGAKTVLERQGGSTIKQPSDVSRPAVSDNQDRSGRLSKKGSEVKEVRHRYLFAIEDPFEVDHNVARTVTHNGIVSIRDEFRRAWRIIRTAEGESTAEDLLRDVKDMQEDVDPFLKMMDDIHGPPRTWMAMHHGEGRA